jgi:hypothetical protein
VGNQETDLKVKVKVKLAGHVAHASQWCENMKKFIICDTFA